MKKKRILKEAGILIAIFLMATVVFSFVINKGNESMTEDISSATYPQLNFSCQSFAVNTLSGYAKEMDVTAIRDTITPVINGRMNVNLKNYDNIITGIDYEVYSLDGSEKLYKATINEPEELNIFEFPDREILKEQKVMKVTLHTEDKDIYYYTRIVEATDSNVLVCLNYMRDFHEHALSKAENTGVGKAIEPNEKGDNTTFQHVTINSDYDHVTWGALEPKVQGDVKWNITELNNSYTCVLLEYQVRCIGEENDADTYKVREYFKVRHSEGAKKTYLLSYDREMEQIFDPRRQVLGKKGIILGIADNELSYMANKKGTIVSFVQANELWTYNKDTDKISKIFSFTSDESFDERNLTDKHKIKILRTDKAGNIVFAVCGYMNRGNHEGEMGIAVYYYDAKENSVEEKTFVAFDRVMESDIYYNMEKELLYVMANGSVYEIAVSMGQQKTIIEGLGEDEYVISPNGNIIAYTPQDGAKNQINILYLASGNEQTVSCNNEEELVPIGFIGNDFVYGVKNQGDTGNDISGRNITPMYKIEIQDKKGKVVMTYEQNGIYILNASIQDNMITLERGEEDKKKYSHLDYDYVTNNEAAAESKIVLESYVTEFKQSQRRLAFVDGIEDTEPKIHKANHLNAKRKTDVELEVSIPADYYLYAYGEMQSAYESLADAIADAKECTGVITDAKQNCIWETGNRDLVYTITERQQLIQDLAARIEQGASPMEAVESMENIEILDLSGCKAEDLLYIVNQEIPVIAVTGSNKAVILTGYNEVSVFYLNPKSGERQGVSVGKIDEMTAKSGHTYIGIR